MTVGVDGRISPGNYYAVPNTDVPHFTQDLADRYPQGFVDCLFREPLANLDMETYSAPLPVVNLDPYSARQDFTTKSILESLRLWTLWLHA